MVRSGNTGSCSLGKHQLQASSPPPPPTTHTGQRRGWPFTWPHLWPSGACPSPGPSKCRNLQPQLWKTPEQHWRQNTQLARIPKLNHVLYNKFCTNLTSERKHMLITLCRINYNHILPKAFSQASLSEAKFITWNHFAVGTGMLWKSLSLSKCEAVCFRSLLHEFETNHHSYILLHFRK